MRPDGVDPSPPVVIDGDLLDRLLAQASDLAELKVVLRVMRLAAQRKAGAVPLEAVLAPPGGRPLPAPTSPEPAEERMGRSVERAVADGFLLRLTVRTGDEESVRLLPASAANRALLERLQAGEAQAGDELALPTDADVVIHRPNVFSLYEQFVGPLTPLVAEQILDAERAYPRGWLEAAIQLAAEYNRRSWRYVQTILTRWEENGAPDGASRNLPRG